MLTTGFYSGTFCVPLIIDIQTFPLTKWILLFQNLKWSSSLLTKQQKNTSSWGAKSQKGLKNNRREKMDARHHCFAWKSLLQAIALKGNFFILHLVTVRCWIEQPDFPAAGMGGLWTNYGAACSKVALCLGFCAVEKCADLRWFM